MLSTKFVAPINLNLDYRRIYTSLGLNEERPRKTINWQAPDDFLIKLVFQIINHQGLYYVLGYFVESPDVRRLFPFSKIVMPPKFKLIILYYWI